MLRRKRKMIVNSTKIIFTAISENEAYARMAVTAFMSSLDPTVNEMCDIKTAVSEAVTNCIVHGYKEKSGNVTIYARISDKRKITITIKDRGCGIGDIEKAQEPLFTTCTNGERAGLGFALMKEVCDKITVKSELNKGTTVTLYKQLT